MFRFIFFALIFFTLNAEGQSEFKIYFENNGKGTSVYADNPYPIQQSAKVKFDLNNLKNQNSPDSIYVVPAYAKRHLLTNLTIVNFNKSYNAGTKAIYNFGNHHQTAYDKDFIYHLPFPTGKEYKIYQGYNGRVSHKGENALDFSLAEGDAIWAARGGIVFQVVENNSRNCFSPNCDQYNNYISIVHSDGTIAEYTHLKQNGAIVNIGDTVAQDQLIGYSGKTGWTDGPHLHFEVFLQRLQSKETVKTLFKIGEKSKPVYLEEKNFYKRDY